MSLIGRVRAHQRPFMVRTAAFRSRNASADRRQWYSAISRSVTQFFTFDQALSKEPHQ